MQLAFTFDLIDPEGLMHDTLNTIRTSKSKVETVVNMIQGLIMDNVASGLLNIPPPILSPTIEEIGRGMHRFREVAQIAEVPFPYPYIIVTEMILLAHALYTPLMLAFWCEHAGMAFASTFLTTFSLWFFN